MKSSHSRARRARSQGRYSRGLTRSARGKASHGSEFPRGACQSAAEVIFRIAVAAWKTGTAGTNDGGDLGSGDAMAEQLLGDPLIDNAPIWLREASTNSQPVEPVGVDLSGSRWVGARTRITSNQQRCREWRPHFRPAAAKRRLQLPCRPEHTRPSPRGRTRVRCAAAAFGW